MTEQEMKELFEKEWNDSTYAINTHFNALADRLEAAERQIKAAERQIQIQNRVIKELWAWKKRSVMDNDERLSEVWCSRSEDLAPVVKR